MVTEDVRTDIRNHEIRNEPEEWQLKSFNELFSLEYGTGNPEKNRGGSKYPVFGSNGIIGFVEEYLVQGPGIIVGRKGSIGKVTWSNVNFWPIDTTYYLKLKSKTDLKWLFYELSNLKLEKLNTATGVPGLNRNDVYNISSLIPNFNEQQKIAKILSDTDTLIESLDKLITKKKNIKQGLMQTLLARGIGHTKFKTTEIGEIPKELATKKFYEILKTVKGTLPHTLLDYDESEKLQPYLSAEYLRGHYEKAKYCFIEDEKRITTVDKDDIIVIWDGSNAGEFLLGMKGVLSSTMAKVVFKEGRISREFIYYFLKRCEGILKNTTKGSTIPHVDGNTLSNLDILLPTLQEQQKIAKILSDADSEIVALEQKKDKYKILKTGMMQQFLTGGIRVK
jgi:type I restriction enzyme S subunit